VWSGFLRTTLFSFTCHELRLWQHFEIFERPAAIKERLGRRVKTKVAEPALTRDGLNPV